MTLLIAWTGIDTHGVASAYIGADSRISWGDNHKFDNGRKVFGLDNHPDIFGYCGDVLFPMLVLGQVSEMADASVLFAEDVSVVQKSQAVLMKLQEQFNRYPSDVASISQDSLTVVHISRNLLKPPDFRAFEYRWTRRDGWSNNQIAFPTTSGLIGSWGSGSQSFSRLLRDYDDGPSGGTSRAVFQCFCNSVSSTEDKYTGGAPQLVGLYRGREPRAQKYGIIFKEQRFLFGASVEDIIFPGDLEWRNERFELCDGRTKLRKDEAQPQPDPLVAP